MDKTALQHTFKACFENLTPDKSRRNPNLKVDMPNRHVESSEYRLRGSTIVAVSTTEPDTVAGTAAAQIESRIS